MILYTRGIRKILSLTSLIGMDFEKAKKIANTTGYEALSFNGTVYVKTSDSNRWIETPFVITDFSTEE